MSPHSLKTLITLLLSCGLASCVSAPRKTLTQEFCRVSDLGIRPFTVAGPNRIFVEPQATALSAGRLLVAGTPSYFWTKGDSGFSLTRDSVVAIISDSSGASTAVRGPIGPGRTHSVRAASLKDGRWILAFGEGAPLGRPYDDPGISSVWVGVVDASGAWQRLEKLPSLGGRVAMDGASISALSADDIALAVPVERNDSVHVSVFTRTTGGWRQSLVMTREANYTALALEDVGRLTLGVVHLDPSGEPDHNSLWLYRTSDGAESWSPAVRRIQGLGQPVHHPRFSLSGNGTTAVWLTMAGGVAEARFTALGRGDSASVLAFGTGAEQVSPRSPIGSASVWTTYHQFRSPNPPAELRVWASFHENEPPRRVGVFSAPFDGVVGLETDGRLILTAGPVRGTSPSEPGVSLALHRIAVRCE